LENCSKKEPSIFEVIQEDLWLSRYFCWLPFLNLGCYQWFGSANRCRGLPISITGERLC